MGSGGLYGWVDKSGRWVGQMGGHWAGQVGGYDRWLGSSSGSGKKVS